MNETKAAIMMVDRIRHPLNQSRLYRIQSPAQLAERLQSTLTTIEELCAADENYIRFEKDGRSIQQPKPRLRHIHKRVANLLSRIEPPAFLHSATKGRSYLSNAHCHSISHPTIKLDIRAFFASVRGQNVYHFFNDKMQCAPHIAGKLTKLLTVDGHLATGSSASPLLSYYAYMDMFDELNQLAASRGCIMTVYVDDITFTGVGATGPLKHEASCIIAKYRLSTHKKRRFQIGQARVVTGVALTRVGSKLPNKRKRIIAEDIRVMGSSVSEQEKLNVAKKLQGRLFEAAQVDPETWGQPAMQFLKRRRKLEKVKDTKNNQ